MRIRRAAAAPVLTPAAAALVVVIATAVPARAQDLGRLAAGSTAAELAFSFPARSNVCGAGDAILIREEDGATTFISGRMNGRDWRAWRDGDPPCASGDVVVRLRRSGTGYSDAELRVGAPPAGAGNLGHFTGQAAADFLLDRASTADGKAARVMIVAASLAGEAVTWPALLRLAKDRSLPARTRKTALHWLGREAAAEAVRELGGIVRDRTEADEIRETAVFALSQLPRGEGVPLLIDLVRTTDDPRVRKGALFWLADSEDARAVALFEEILRADCPSPRHPGCGG